MPVFRASGKLVYYAHVPKCGGSSVANYLAERFGPLGFHDNAYTSRPEPQRWTRSSPQHVDAATLERLLPPGLFDAMFAVVRHPVQRVTSIYHFQAEVEGSIPPGTSFSDWLASLQPNAPEAPFAYDNHIRPMTQIVPEAATVFHLEHGLDAVIGWFDHIAGDAKGPRAILPENRQGEYQKAPVARVKPSPEDLSHIAELYAEDFSRFGYDLASPKPKAAAPVLSAAFLAERDRALAAAQSPLARLRRKISRRMARLGSGL